MQAGPSSHYKVTCYECSRVGKVIFANVANYSPVLEPGWWYLHPYITGGHCSRSPLTSYIFCPECTAKKTEQFVRRCPCGAARATLVGSTEEACLGTTCEKAYRATWEMA